MGELCLSQGAKEKPQCRLWGQAGGDDVKRQRMSVNMETAAGQGWAQGAVGGMG